MDTSVWIDHMNDQRTGRVMQLRSFLGRRNLLVGDLILVEVLQGVRDDGEARRMEQLLRRFRVEAMSSPDLAVKAASNYRRLHGLGLTIRKTIDLLIGTFCIEHGHLLLHSDRDFDPMVLHLGLEVVRP